MKRISQCICTLILLTALIYLGGLTTNPSIVYGDEDSFMIYGQKSNAYKHYNTEDKEPSYCFDADLGAPSLDGSKYKRDFEWSDNAVSYLMSKAYPATTTFGGVSYADNEARFITQVAVWMYRGFITEDGKYTEKTRNTFSEPAGQYSSIIKKQKPELLTRAVELVKDARENGERTQVPEALKCKIYKPFNVDYQRIVVPPTKGSLQLTKTIVGSKDLLGLTNYDTSKIEFSLFKKEGDSWVKLNDSFVLQKTDNPLEFKGVLKSTRKDTLELSFGLYELRETNCPKGYKPQKEAIPFSITPGKTTILNKENQLINSMNYITPAYLVLKQDTESKKVVASAEFHVSYFSDANAQNALRSWILKSGEDGKVKLDKDHLISGDDLFINADGVGVLPYGGKLVIQESKAPEGYDLSQEILTLNLDDDDAIKHFIDAPPVIENKKRPEPAPKPEKPKKDKPLPAKIHQTGVNNMVYVGACVSFIALSTILYKKWKARTGRNVW